MGSTTCLAPAGAQSGEAREVTGGAGARDAEDLARGREETRTSVPARDDEEVRGPREVWLQEALGHGSFFSDGDGRERWLERRGSRGALVGRACRSRRRGVAAAGWGWNGGWDRGDPEGVVDWRRRRLDMRGSLENRVWSRNAPAIYSTRVGVNLILRSKSDGREK